MLNAYKRIIYLGAAALIFLSITAFLGISGFNFKIHRIFGLLTFTLAVSHFTLIARKNRKMKK